MYYIMSQYISPNSTACIKQAMSVLFSFHYPGKKKKNSTNTQFPNQAKH